MTCAICLWLTSDAMDKSVVFIIYGIGMKYVGHPPNPSMRFQIGLSCAHLPRSTKIVLDQLRSAVHNIDVVWAGVIAVQHWHCTWCIFIDTPPAAPSHPSWCKLVYQICKCTQRSLHLHEIAVTPGFALRLDLRGQENRAQIGNSATAADFHS